MGDRTTARGTGGSPAAEVGAWRTTSGAAEHRLWEADAPMHLLQYSGRALNTGRVRTPVQAAVCQLPIGSPMRDKTLLQSTMLAMEAEVLDHSERTYAEYLSGAQRDASEPVDHDGYSQAFSNAEIAQSFDCPIHGYGEAMAKLREIDFGDKSEVGEGAIVRIGGRWFVIAVATRAFKSAGTSYVGISTQAPIYSAIEGKRAGDCFEFNGHSMKIELVE